MPVLRKMRLGPNSKSEAFGGVPGAGYADWSPDGKWIAAINSEGIHLISADGKESRVLSKLSMESGGPVWSRDSRSLYLNMRNESRILKLTLEGKLTVVRDLPGIRLGLNTPDAMSLSPGGKTPLASERRGQTRVVLLEGLRPPRRFWERWMGW